MLPRQLNETPEAAPESTASTAGAEAFRSHLRIALTVRATPTLACWSIPHLPSSSRCRKARMFTRKIDGFTSS